MKNLLSSIFIVAFALVSNAQSEFSNPTIFVGSVVANLEKSVDFYTNVIGMTKTSEFSVDGEKSKELGLTDGRAIDVVVLKLEDGPQSNEWKLMSFGTKAKHPKQKYLHNDTGMQYITLNVNHLNHFIERVKKNNVKILSSVPSQLGEDRFFILVQDPDGTFIEIIGPR